MLIHAWTNFRGWVFRVGPLSFSSRFERGVRWCLGIAACQNARGAAVVMCCKVTTTAVCSSGVQCRSFPSFDSPGRMSITAKAKGGGVSVGTESGLWSFRLFILHLRARRFRVAMPLRIKSTLTESSLPAKVTHGQVLLLRAFGRVKIPAR